MSEKKRFIILCLLFAASIGLLVFVTRSVDQSFLNQF